MQTFIIGAGASHSYSQSPTGVKPPLALGFFQTFRALDIAADRFVRVGDVINYVRDTRGLRPLNFGIWEENIEDFLTEIDELIGTKEAASKLSFETMIRVSRAYDQMIFLFASVLNEIQNGPVCDNYSWLCSQLDENDTIISFNWDTLVDRALKDTGIWWPDDGYGLEFVNVFRDGWEEPREHKGSKLNSLKLHGSTNWIMPYLTLRFDLRERRFQNPAIAADERPMFCFEFATKPYVTYHNRSKPGYQPFSYYYYPPDIPVRTDSQAPPGMVRMSVVAAPDVPEHGIVRTGGYPTVSMPMIVPPVRNKQYGLMRNALDSVWDQAAHAIENAEELTIIGYSFPVTDTRAWSLLENSIKARKKKLTLQIVDPYPEQLEGRILERLAGAVDVSSHKMTFEAYTAN